MSASAGTVTANAIGMVPIFDLLALVNHTVLHLPEESFVARLTHGGVTKVVVDGQGGSADDLKQTFTVAGFAGANQGSWTLRVIDNAAQDTGTLNSWSLETKSH